MKNKNKTQIKDIDWREKPATKGDVTFYSWMILAFLGVLLDKGWFVFLAILIMLLTLIPINIKLEKR